MYRQKYKLNSDFKLSSQGIEERKQTIFDIGFFCYFCGQNLIFRMQEDKFKVFNYSMHYGVALGFFWAFKYLFHIGATYYSYLDFVYQSLSIGTIFLIYYLTKRYRDKVNGGEITYLHCISFTVQLCFFASLIEAVVSYFHYTVIDPSYISTINKQLFLVMKEMNFSKEFMHEAEQISFGPLYYTISQIIGNVIFGFIYSLISGFLISKKIKMQ